ncbi:MAG: ATP-binding protein [Desulfobacteraceae bacterium]|nr:ATP-binding protein [Desulfobacteraceae bacterium]
MEARIKFIFTAIAMIFIAGFFIFFNFYQHYSYQKAGRRLQTHARVIAGSLWRYERDEPVAYLHLAAQSNNYKKMVVVDDSEKEFVSITSREAGPSEPLMTALGLLPVHSLETDILYKDAAIGKIMVDWQNRSVFVYFYILVCLILSLMGIWFFLNLILAKKTLEERVLERTSALEESRGKLQSLRNFLSNIIDSMPSVLVGIDLEGKITQWNKKAALVTGIPSEEAMGQAVEQVYPQLAHEMDRVRRAILTRREQCSKKQARTQEKEQRYEDITIYPLIADDVEGAVIRIDDVTEQIRLEEMMVQSEKMLSVGGLAAGMAHEINNPLAGIIQTAGVMKNRLTDLNMPANQRAAQDIGISMDGIRAFMDKREILSMIEAVNESGRRVAEIVNNMLSFARKADARFSSHDPRQLLDKILELAATEYDLKKQYDFKTIKIVKEYEDHLPMLPCEGAKIQQVILNLLRNGAQAMQEANPGKHAQPCFILRLYTEKTRKMLTMEIEDNGPGMDEAVCKRVFEPFFTTKPPGVGTGLGLSVSYFIITQNHGGTMDVKSVPGKGTTFIIRLPLERTGTP